MPEEYNVIEYQRTYSGLLDDVMIRYSGAFQSRTFFNKMLAKNLFFGGGMYFNDGYLVNHPVARHMLRDENSLLRTMMSTGFIHILTRTKTPDDLSQMPELMARQGNDSFIRLVNGRHWTEFRNLWTEIAHAAFFKNYVTLWPNYDMSYTYTELIRRTVDKLPADMGMNQVSDDEWKRITDDFFARRPQVSGPRGKLELAARHVLADKSNFREAMNDVMNVANQAYHYNFGLTLTKETKSKQRVGVDTTIGKAFDELLLTREINEGTLDELGDVPIMWLPKRFPLNNGDVFRPLVDPGTEIYGAKRDYLLALRSIVSSEFSDVRHAKARLVDESRRYRDRLVMLLSRRLGRRRLEDLFDNGFTVAFGGLMEDVSGPVATVAANVGTAITLQDEFARRNYSFLIDRFTLRNVSDRFQRTDGTAVRLHEITPHIASLAFNEAEAEAFVRNAPAAPVGL